MLTKLARKSRAQKKRVIGLTLVIELRIGAGIHISGHFIHYHIHLRLGG